MGEDCPKGQDLMLDADCNELVKQAKHKQELNQQLLSLASTLNSKMITLTFEEMLAAGDNTTLVVPHSVLKFLGGDTTTLFEETLRAGNASSVHSYIQFVAPKVQRIFKNYDECRMLMQTRFPD